MNKKQTDIDLRALAQAALSKMFSLRMDAAANRPPHPHEIENKDKRGEVRVSLYDQGPYELPSELPKLIKWLEAILSEVPPKLRRRASIDIDARMSYGDTFPHVEIYYFRPETDDEWAARKADVERRMALQADRDRDEFERLRERFEAAEKQP